MATEEADPPVTVGEFTRLKAWVKSSLEKHADWYKEARECFDFVAGRQWSDDDKKNMEDTFRTAVEINLCGVTVDHICGMEVNNRQDVKYLPRTQGAVKANERLSSLGDWARDECQAEDEESGAFRDDAICGRGWTETRMDYAEEPKGKITVDRIDPLECGVDPASRKSNFGDSRFRWRYKDMDTAEAEALFPGVIPAALNAKWAYNSKAVDGGEGNKRDYPEETRSALKEDDRPKSVRVVQIQWWDETAAYMVAHPEGGDPKEVDAETWDAQKDQAEAAGFQAAKIRKHTYYQAFLGSTDVLPGRTEIKCFTLNAMTGKWDRNKGYHYGVIRAMMDPQRMVNKALAQYQRIFDTNAKGGLLAEKGVFSNQRDAERDWSNPSKMVLVNEGALSGKKIMPREAPQMPQAVTEMLQFAMSAIRDVVGINLEALGMADREQAASLEYQRRQAATTILASLFDSLRRYRKTQGKVMIVHLRMLSPGVIVRVIGEDDAAQQDAQGPQQEPGQAKEPVKQFMPFDPAAFGLDDESAEFDVIVDEAPTSPNQKEATWNALQPFLPKLAESPAAITVALKYSPLPSAAAQELGAALSQQGQLPPEVQHMIQQGQETIQQLTQENQQLKADHAAKEAKASTDQFKAETDRQHKLGPDDGVPEWVKMQFEQQREETARQFDVVLEAMRNLTSIEVARIGATKGSGDPDAEADAHSRLNGA